MEPEILSKIVPKLEPNSKPKTSLKKIRKRKLKEGLIHGNAGQKRTKQQFNCQYCKVNIYTKINWLQHEQLCKIVGKYRRGKICILCQSNIYSANLKSHFLEKHGDQFNNAEKEVLSKSNSSHCKHCKLYFKQNLFAHESTCEQFIQVVRGTQCLICNKSFQLRKHAVHHVKKFHKQNLQEVKKGIFDFKQEPLEIIQNPIESPVSREKITKNVLKNENTGEGKIDTLEDQNEATEDIDIGTTEDIDTSDFYDTPNLIIPDVKMESLEVEKSECESPKIDSSVQIEEYVSLDEANDLNNEVSELEHEKGESSDVSENCNGKMDSTMIVNLYKCPLCRGVFGYTDHIEDHIEVFHGVQMSLFEELQLPIKRFAITDIKNNQWK